MAGTKEGGQAAAATNKKKYGENFYKEIGAKGGRKGNTGGFAYDRLLAVRAGTIGGTLSRRDGRTWTPEEKLRRKRLANKRAEKNVRAEFNELSLDRMHALAKKWARK